MLTSPTVNVLVCGIGGQGVMTAADVLAQAAVAHGHDCKKSEIAGMSQRGGVVTSHVRFGPKIFSPVIGPGCADPLLAFELAEALRAKDCLKIGGIALVNTVRLAPPAFASMPWTPARLPLSCRFRQPILKRSLSSASGHVNQRSSIRTDAPWPRVGV